MNDIKLIFDSSLKCVEYLGRNSVDTVVTSPPYWKFREYPGAGPLGQEKEVEDYIETIAVTFGNAFKEVIKEDGVYFLNVGDKMLNKDMMYIPQRIALRMKEVGWHLKNFLLWVKTDPPPKNTQANFGQVYEPIIMASKSKDTNFFYDRICVDFADSTYRRWEQQQRKGKQLENSKYKKAKIRRAFGGKCQYDKLLVPDVYKHKGKNMGNVWYSPVSQVKAGHVAPFHISVPENAILSTCPPGGVVLDPFMGSGTSGIAAIKCNRSFVGFDTDIECFFHANSRMHFAQQRINHLFKFYGINGFEDLDTFYKRGLPYHILNSWLKVLRIK